MAELAISVRFFVAALFLAAGLLKLQSQEPLREVVARYGVLPSVLVRPIARVLIPLELLASSLLLLGVESAAMLRILGSTLVCFASAVAYNLLRSRVIDCGCWGSKPSPITWRLAARNGTIGVTAWIAASWQPHNLAMYNPSGRADSIAIGTAVGCLVLTALGLVAWRLAMVLVEPLHGTSPRADGVLMGEVAR